MFPNVRLIIVAVVASVVALSFGFGVFAALRVNHEPLARLPSVTAPVQLAADNPAPTSVTIAPAGAIGSRLQFTRPPQSDDGPENTASILAAVQPSAAPVAPPAERTAATGDGPGEAAAPSLPLEAKSAPEVRPALAANDPPQGNAATVAAPAEAASNPAPDNAPIIAPPAAVASDPLPVGAVARAQPAATANDPAQDSAVAPAQPTVTASNLASDDPAPATDAQPVVAAGTPTQDSAAMVAQPAEGASEPAQDQAATVASAQLQPAEEASPTPQRKASGHVLRRRPVAKAPAKIDRKIIRRAVVVPQRVAIRTYRVRRPRARAVAGSYSADPSAAFLAPNFQSAPPVGLGGAPVKGRRTARRTAIQNSAVGGPFVAPPAN